MPPLDPNELLGLLRKAVDKVRSANLRAEQAEARVELMSRKAEEILANVEAELDEALTGQHAADMRARDAEASLALLEAEARDLEARATGAEARASGTEARATAAEARALASETELRDWQERATRAIAALTPAAPLVVANGADVPLTKAVVH